MGWGLDKMEGGLQLKEKSELRPSPSLGEASACGGGCSSRPHPAV